jgi:shikimate kinase
MGAADPGRSGPRAVLIGTMAAGKTSVGRELASLWGVGFVDLDAEIVDRAELTIPELFARHGERGFREAETLVLEDLLRTYQGVLALGGGAPMTPANRRLLDGAPVVLLEVDEELAAARLHGGSGRPMLTGQDPMTRWRSLRDERLPVYRELAVVRVDGGAGLPSAVARRIAQELEARTRHTHPDHAVKERP